ncbi:MAG: tRNA (adenosine(37)-N6)-threonylcarbamoyltransferase complex ATPase subunit type 1 TsaE [Parcubacteria group bacterium RIFCSPHIGHO2_01_FULL_56_18]|nr:MAG: tRNA (adenosine(37)-N6)-threonylcarbamoyltransferase complex ATPase subunit type 1 TsaE [Parcubacteria group bacterium RIFCSPHIGHO2_01_FULL_56_18]
MKTVREHEMEEEATAFLASLSPAKSGATIVTFSGDLGAGKTTFVKGIAHALGIEEHITSPTFVILKIYDLHGQKFERLIHMDAYRLKGRQHLKVLGWDELVKDPGNLILVEWPEKIGEAIPEGAKRISLRYSDEGRHIIYG